MVIDNAAGITQNLGSPKGGELLGGLFAPCTSFGPVLKLMNAADFESVTVRQWQSQMGCISLEQKRRLAEQKCQL
jgi:hypothetical protein